MLLHRIHLNPRSKDARRDLGDPYQLHATLCRAFFPQETKCLPGSLLWRQEPETDSAGLPRILAQCRSVPDWSRLPHGWLKHTDPGIDLTQKLALDTLVAGQRFRFRMRANPCKTVNGKRQGIMNRDEQIGWLERKAEQHGFTLPEPVSTDYFEFMEQPTGHAYPNCRITQEQMLTGRKHDGMVVRVYAALYQGQLSVTDAVLFKQALTKGIGHGKMMGLGLLSVVPICE